MATPNSRPLKDAQRKNQAEAPIDNALASSGSHVPMKPTCNHDPSTVAYLLNDVVVPARTPSD
eukprot:5923624-Pyramimonas_sp.AAC.1